MINDVQIDKAKDINLLPAYIPDTNDALKVANHPDQIKLSGDGIFYTVQGEGKTIGYPAIFIRLHFCNLKCTWCDTWYTWDQKSREYWTEPFDITYENLYEEVKKFNCKRLVFTGGEPLLQQHKIIKFLKKYPEFEVEMETNTTLMPDQYLLENIQFNCSPKLQNSLNDKSFRFKPEIIREIAKYNSQFKFVVTSKNDFKEIESTFVESGLIPREKVGVMPEGTNLNENQKIMLAIVDECKQYDYRLLPRLQNIIWGSKRKV